MGLKRATVFLFATILSGVTLTYAKSEPQSVLSEARRTFTLNGQPIHPRVVQHFSCFGPKREISSLNLIESQKESSPEGYAQDKPGYLEVKGGEPQQERGWFGYRHIGVVGDGIHVVTSNENQGGSMSESCVLFLGLKIEGDRVTLYAVEDPISKGCHEVSIQGNNVKLSECEEMYKGISQGKLPEKILKFSSSAKGAR